MKDHVFSTIASTMPIISLSGNLVAGHLADHFGRKWLMIAGTILETLCGLAQSFAPRLVDLNLSKYKLQARIYRNLRNVTISRQMKSS